MTDAVTAYGAAWLETDEGVRRALLERAWAEDAVYVDPLDHVTGREALVGHIGAFQSSMAGGRVEVVGDTARHHDSAHFRWRIVDVTGQQVLTGFDVVQLDAEDRITRLTGSFDT